MRKLSWSSFLVSSGRKTRVAGRILALLCLLAFIFTAKYYISAFNTWVVAPARHYLQSWAEKRWPLQVHFLDVGFGDSILVQCNGHNLLIDGGQEDAGPKVIADLKKCGVKHLDAIVCSHEHADHTGGLLEVYRTFGADKVYASPKVCTRFGLCKRDVSRGREGNSTENNDVSTLAFYGSGSKGLHPLVNEMKQHNQRLIPLKVGTVLPLGDAEISVLGPLCYYQYLDRIPEPNNDCDNNNSLALQMVYGKHSFMFCGDIQSAQERVLVKHYGVSLKSDVLKVAHHGSGTSSTSDFLENVKPERVVVSVGPNKSGLPHQNIVGERLPQYSKFVYRTDKHGTVTAHSNGEKLTYSPEL